IAAAATRGDAEAESAAALAAHAAGRTGAESARQRAVAVGVVVGDVVHLGAALQAGRGWTEQLLAVVIGGARRAHGRGGGGIAGDHPGVVGASAVRAGEEVTAGGERDAGERHQGGHDARRDRPGDAVAGDAMASLPSRWLMRGGRRPGAEAEG